MAFNNGSVFLGRTVDTLPRRSLLRFSHVLRWHSSAIRSNDRSHRLSITPSNGSYRSSRFGDIVALRIIYRMHAWYPRWKAGKIWISREQRDSNRVESKVSKKGEGKRRWKAGQRNGVIDRRARMIRNVSIIPSVTEQRWNYRWGNYPWRWFTEQQCGNKRINWAGKESLGSPSNVERRKVWDRASCSVAFITGGMGFVTVSRGHPNPCITVGNCLIYLISL